MAWYPFNGNADDETGSGLSAIVAGPYLFEDRFGNPNSAYDFEGGYHRIILDSPFTEAVTELSILVWFKPEFSEAPFNQPITLFLQSGANNPNAGFCYFYFSYDPSNIGFGLGVIGSNYANVLIDNVSQHWHCAVLTYNGSALSQYIDSELVWTSPLSLAQYLAYEDIFIGNVSSPPYQGFRGYIDDIAFWNRALTLEEIQALYTPGISGPCIDNYRRGDLDCSGTVNTGDVLILLTEYGQVIE